MDCIIVCAIISIIFFLVALIFFRKDGRSATKFSFRFIFSSFFPGRMKDHLKPIGILFIILGYAFFFVCIFIIEGIKYLFKYWYCLIQKCKDSDKFSWQWYVSRTLHQSSILDDKNNKSIIDLKHNNIKLLLIDVIPAFNEIYM